MPGKDSPLLRIGPVLLALIVGLQVTFWAWGRWEQRTPSQAELDRLTSLARVLYRPDYDMPIYFGGLLLCLFMAMCLGSVWNRRLGSAHSENQLQSMRLILLMHFPVAGGLAFLPLLYIPAKSLSLISAGLGLLFCGAALWAASRPTLSVSHWLRSPRLFWRGTEAAIVIALVILIVYVPHPTRLVGSAYSLDHFHHLDFYAMAPALASRHGVALGTNFYSQYGVGWPMILAFLSTIAPPLSYKLLFGMCVVWGCLYYIALHAFLHRLFRSWTWATAGLLLVLLLQLMSGADGLPKWLWPSSTVMRHSMDVFLFSACLMHARTGRAWLGLPAGIFAALAVLLSTDTGLYLLVCLGGYLLAVGRLQPETASPRRVGGFAALTLLGFASVLMGGLAIASRGTLVRPEFWLGWTESLRLYNNGFTHLPIAGAIHEDWTAFVLLVLMLTCYLFAVGRLIQGFLGRRLTPEHLIVGLIAAYGLAMLLLFVGRSHPYNLLHASIPFCIVLTSFAVELCDVARRRAAGARSVEEQALLCAALKMVPLAYAYAALVGIFVHPSFQNYPNVFRWFVQDRLKARPIPASNYLFASRRDAPLADRFHEDIVKFQAVTSTIRELSDGGRKSVGMIDGFDTSYLVEADLRPHFRYSPVLANLVFKYQVDFLDQQIVDDPPDYILIPLVAPMMQFRVRDDDTYQKVLGVVQRLFTLDRQVADMAVYRRKVRE